MTVRVRAKFKVQSVTEMDGGLKTATLHPVPADTPENKEFFKTTPTGQIQLGVMNESVSKRFYPGRVFYVDFLPEDDADERGEWRWHEHVQTGDVPIGQVHIDAMHKDKGNMSNR